MGRTLCIGQSKENLISKSGITFVNILTYLAFFIENFNSENLKYNFKIAMTEKLEKVAQ